MGTQYENIEDDFSRLKEKYPGLEMIHAITNPTAVGFVMADTYKDFPKDIQEQYSLRIKIEYPQNFPSSTIKVYDIDNRIKWDKIPYEHWHINADGALCTHHYREIARVKPVNRSFLVVYNALALFYAYKHYLKTHQWILPDLPHGNAAIKVLNQESLAKRK